MEMLNKFIKLSKNFRNVYEKTDKEILKLEGISSEQLDPSCMSERYFSERLADMSVDDNSNHVQEYKAFSNYISEMGKSSLKLLGFNDLYVILEKKFGTEKANKIISSLWDGDLYLHDSTCIQVPYCWAFSVDFLLHKGNFWGQLKSFVPKRARSFIDQVKEVTIEFAQEVAGAVAIGDLFVCYSYFIKKDKLNIKDLKIRKEIENDFQSLVHTLNKKLRPSHQSPFSNISIFDKPNLEHLFGEMRFPDGSRPDMDLILEIQKIFCDWFCKGDPFTGLPYRFPIVTLNLRVDEKGNILDKSSLDYFSEINLEKGCFNIYISSGNKIASCCRLINDFDLAGCDSFGNGGISLGSHRVVAINMARLGNIANSYTHLTELLNDRLSEAKDVLIAHRELLDKRFNQNFLPFMHYGLIQKERLFSTFGINGIYECLEELGISILTKKGKKLVHSLLDQIKSYAKECNQKYKVPFNVEQVPAESLAVKFAEKDKLLKGMNYEIYSNQFIPLWVDYDIVDRIKLDGEFSKSLTGGGISHLNIGEKLTSKDQMKKLIEYAVKAGCEHFAVNYNFSKCKKNHVIVSDQTSICPICGEEIIEQYTRIIGYFTPVSTWNRGRQAEFKKRVFKKDFFNDNLKKSKEKNMSL